MRRTDPLRDLRAAVTRLSKSSTPKTRRNAKNAVRVALRRTWKELDSAFPSMRDDGSVIVRPKKRGAMCPICSVPMQSMPKLLTHLCGHNCDSSNPYMVRFSDGEYKCLCGKRAKRRGMMQHLRRVGDLQAHLAGAVLKNATQTQFTVVGKRRPILVMPTPMPPGQSIYVAGQQIMRAVRRRKP